MKHEINNEDEILDDSNRSKIDQGMLRHVKYNRHIDFSAHQGHSLSKFD